MTATPLRRTFRFCAGFLAASMTLQEAAGAQNSRTVPNNYSCYNTEAVAINNWNTADINAFAQATKKVGGQALRVPGGDTANYWHWEDYTYTAPNGNQETADYGPDGSIVSWIDFDSGSFDYTRKPDIFPFFLPQTLPASLQFEPTTNNATLENVEKLVTGAAAEPIWVMNMNTSFLEKEIAHLQKAQSLGMDVKRIELGNELYFRGGFDDDPNLQRNYVRDPRVLPQVGGYPEPIDYAKDAKLWADTIRTVFPDAKIAITGLSDITPTVDPRLNTWMSEIQKPIGTDGRSAIDAVDAFTIHPYYNASDLGVTLNDAAFAQPQRAGEIARAGMSKLRGLLNDPDINTPGLQNKEVWVTEHNIIESDVVAVGNTWFGALMVDMHGHEFLKDQRTQLSCAHVLTGNPQWQAIADESGSVIDPAKRGIDPQPFSNIAQPFAQTATGLVLGQSAEVFTEGTATLLQSGDASIAWRVQNDDGDKISAVNAGDVDEQLELPAGEIWEVLTYSGDPWATITDEEELDILLEIVTGGSTISIPAFSKLLATADPNAVRPQAPAGASAEATEDSGIAEGTEATEEAATEEGEEGTIIAAAPGAALIAVADSEGEENSAAEEENSEETDEVEEIEVSEAEREADAEAESKADQDEKKAERRAERIAAKRAKRLAERRTKQIEAKRAKRLAEKEGKLVAAANEPANEVEADAVSASTAEEPSLLIAPEAAATALLDVTGTVNPEAIEVALVEALETVGDFETPSDALAVADETTVEAVETDPSAILAENWDTVAVASVQKASAPATAGVLAEVSADSIMPLDVAVADTIGSDVSDVLTLADPLVESFAIANSPAAAGLYSDSRESKSVPEPAAVLGLGLMAASLAASRRRHKPSKPDFSKVS